MIDIRMLQIMKYREDYYRMYTKMPKESLNKQTVALMVDFGKFFREFPDKERVELDTFVPLFNKWHPKLDDAQKQAYYNVLKDAMQDVSEVEYEVLFKSMAEMRLSNTLANALLRFEEGDEENIYAKIREAVSLFEQDSKVSSLDYIRDPIGDLLLKEENDDGFTWRLSVLNAAMRPLRPGDFGIVAARPDKGKTTFLASEITYMASQMDKDRCILWLNNEGPGQKIRLRTYQSAIGCTMSEMIELNHEKMLEPKYEKATGGVDRIRVFDVHGMDIYDVENIITANNPQIVVFDMIDNIRGFGDAARTDLGLEKMYQWARESGVKYNFAGIATSQISNEGDGLLYPTLGMLKDSKTGKQGACDFQLMIGASNDPSLSSSRYLSLPKNKLRREGAFDLQEQVAYKPYRARYEDVIESTEDYDNE